MTFPYDIETIFENEDFLVINKPSGLLVHDDGKTKEPTLADWLLETRPRIKNVGEPWQRDDGTVIPRPGIVHRLDRETSGVMVIAKTQESFLHLKEQFQKRLVKKVYNAFVYGVLKEKDGVIERPIGKSRKDFRLWSAQRGARGKIREALTKYTVLKEGNDTSYLEIRPKTGRTHQIRVHLKAIHHPVVCDKLYAPKQECILGLNRLALHATSITFETMGGEKQAFLSPIPQSFEQALALLS